MALSPAEGTESREGFEDRLRRLMDLYQRANAGAAEEVVRLVTPLLFRFLSGLRHAPGEVDDLVQECWLRIHKARHTYRPGEPVLPWVFAIARHARVDQYRRRRRTEGREVALADHEADRVATSASVGQGSELRQLLDALPASQREVIVMLKVTGMTLEEVARATSCTVGAVKQKAHRAYEKLRRLLAAAERRK